MKGFFKVDEDYCLEPHDKDTQKYILNRKVSDIISAEIKQARNYENHKRFFSFIDTTFDMQEHFTSKEHYRKWLIMKCGWYDTIVAPNGNTIFTHKSISFESMDEIEFRELFSQAIDVFIAELGNGMTDKELMKVIQYD